MRIAVEIRSFMSRVELMKAMQLTLEAATRLAPRMSRAELQRIENFGAALIAAAEHERESRRESQRSVAALNKLRIETIDRPPRKIELAGGEACGDRGGRADVPVA